MTVARVNRKKSGGGPTVCENAASKKHKQMKTNWLLQYSQDHRLFYRMRELESRGCKTTPQGIRRTIRTWVKTWHATTVGLTQVLSKPGSSPYQTYLCISHDTWDRFSNRYALRGNRDSGFGKRITKLKCGFIDAWYTIPCSKARCIYWRYKCTSAFLRSIRRIGLRCQSCLLYISSNGMQSDAC